MDDLFFQGVLNSLEEQLAIIDKSGNILFVNESWKRFGVDNGFNPAQDWIGINYLDVCKSAGLHGDNDAIAVTEGIASVLSGNRQFFEHEYPCHSPDEKRWFILRATPVKDRRDGLFVLTHQNITRRKLAEEAIAYSSLHDSLTDLANRRHFDEFLSNEWRRCLRERNPICILMLDLDYFKKFNDEKGHLEGDQCLKTVAGIIRLQATRGSDIAARFGGDEFSVVLGDTPTEGGLLVANRIMEKIRGLGMHVATGEAVSVSIGLSGCVPGTGQCTDELALLLLADSALYKAKANGKNRVEIL